MAAWASDLSRKGDNRLLFWPGDRALVVQAWVVDGHFRMRLLFNGGLYVVSQYTENVLLNWECEPPEQQP